MAASTATSDLINSTSGKVVLKETGIGIPDLLVVIYDVDPGAPSEEEVPVAGTPGTALSASGVPAAPGDRLGSVLTARDGSWSLDFGDREFQIANPKEKRPDLLLLVLGPEDAESTDTPVVLYSSRVPRMNSGRCEAALIRIGIGQLVKAGIPVPVAEPERQDVESAVQQLRDQYKARRDLKAGMRAAIAENDVLESDDREAFRALIKRAITTDLSALNPKIHLATNSNPIPTAQTAAIGDGLDDINASIQPRLGPDGNPVPGEGMKISLVLTEDDLAGLTSFQVGDSQYFSANEAQIKALMFRRAEADDVGAILFADSPIAKYCIQRTTAETCAREHTDIPVPGAHDNHPGTESGTVETGGAPSDADGRSESDGGTGGAASDSGGGNDASVIEAPAPPILTKQDIPALLASVLAANGTSSLFTSQSLAGVRPDSSSVQDKVDTFSLKKGPADSTAYYDFHSLQIAFPYVWQQVLDESLVTLADRIDGDLEASGRKGLGALLNTQVSIAQNGGYHNLVSVASDAAMHAIQIVPPDISAAFDISLLEFDALSPDEKSLLLRIAWDVNANELDPERATEAAVRRDQGERIIDNARVNKPFSTNAMLKELQERLLSKYEFTIFAADQDHHSVNFGLMNTFRQKWEPISYQAGKLVKTRPLVPKEECRYSSKVTHNRKITEKQAIKNNSTLANSIDTTNRAESEIVAKAHDKSNFNMSAKVDFSHFSSQAGFSTDAEKESSETKKDFREAVIKAAQEYKEERSIEVNTERTLNSEYEESGTIVNPNDELSLTCLFYELQRRYRVSEQLYRVMPVVLVAQQVPAPNEITEGWVVANDWILNRVLLDDSFRPTLQYIAQKNVGDDFAIRELRKNLRAQRTLVNNLQLELAKLKRDVDSKYAAMERAVNERINEEHVKRTTTWWDYMWEDKDERPDPEMAKALEKAATDEHKYAVEKAQNMALAVQREVNSLQGMTAEYNRSMQEHLDRMAQVRRFLAHLKNNILYYMQAIWSMEPPDQRYMRLYKVPVPQFEATQTCVIDAVPADDIYAAFRAPGKKKYTAWLKGEIKHVDGQPDVTYKQLIEVADIDTVLGFKANCIVFPMKEHNPLTSFMAAPYVDEAFGAMDPDQLSNISLEEFSKFICCFAENEPEKFEEWKSALTDWLKQLLADPLRNGDEIIVPTGSLFIELLPSDKSLLEDFKLLHREWDVFKVQAEVRKLELENIRYAARLLDERMDDPDIDKQILLATGAQPVIDVDA